MAERVRKSTRKAARGGAVCSTNRASAVYGHGAMTPRRSTIAACWRQDGDGLAHEHHGRVVDAGLAHERASGVDLVMQQRCSASRCCLCGCCCCCSLARSCLTHITQHSSETQQRDSSDTQTATAVSETQRRGRSWRLMVAARRLCRRVWSLLCCRCMHAHWVERGGEHLARHSSTGVRQCQRSSE